MGSPKALLADPDGDPFVVRIVRTLSTAGLTDITIVAGLHHHAIVEALDRYGQQAVARVIRNPYPSRGQLSSLVHGLDASPADIEGVLATLVDVPMVEPATVRAVVKAWSLRRASIVRPAIGTRHGHPVIFDRRLFGALRTASPHEGAKGVIRSYAEQIENVPVDDTGCLVDIDTPEDYERLRTTT
jgi:molybdenum cofactor cytidylyltransferase